MFYCPVCKSHQIYPVAGGFAGQIYICKDCGYRGSFILEPDDRDSLHGTEKDKKDNT